MRMDKTFWPWVLILMISMTVSGEFSVTKLSSRREELSFLKNLLSVLEQLVKDQSTTMKNIRGELHEINEKMPNDIGGNGNDLIDNISSVAVENKRQDGTILYLEMKQQLFESKLNGVVSESKEIASNITSIAVENEMQNASITKHVEKQQSLERKLNDLEGESKGLIRKISSIEIKTEKQEDTIRQYNLKQLSLERKLIGIDNRLVQISNMVSTIESKHSDQQSNMNRYESKQNLLERRFDQGIGFTAQLEYKTSISNLKNGEKIVFGHIISNLGNAYDKNTGIFTCPKSGIYGFYYNIHTAINKFALIGLTNNGKTVYSYAFSGGHSSAETDGSTFVVLSLVKGNKIWKRFVNRGSYKISRKQLFWIPYSCQLV